MRRSAQTAGPTERLRDLLELLRNESNALALIEIFHQYRDYEGSAFLLASGLYLRQISVPKLTRAFFPINPKNRRVRSPSLLSGCFDLGGCEIVR